MRIETFGQGTTFAQLAPGAVYRAARQRQEFLALKVATPQRSGWVVLDPPLADPRHLGMLFVTPVSVGEPDRPVFELTDAAFRVSADLAALSLDPETVYGPGDCVIGDDGKVYLCVLSAGAECHIDLETGEFADVRRGLVVISKWSIVQLVDGKARPVIDFTSRRARRAPQEATGSGGFQAQVQVQPRAS